MTPFLQLRLWWRRGSSGEKVASVLAGMLVLALAAWILVPASDDAGDATAVSAGNTGAATAGAGAGPAATDGSTTGATVAGATGTPAAGGTAAGATGGAAGAAGPTASAGAGGAGCLPNGSKGVTDKEIKIAVPLLDLAGPIGNGAAGQAAADDTQKIADEAIKDVNARGGVQCRKLVPKYYKLNPIGPDQGRSGCLQILQDGPAIVADVGGFAFPQGAYLCIPQQKVPIIAGGNLTPSEVSKYSPYIAAPAAEMATIMRDTAFGFRDRGFFDPAKGFKKLGLLYDECSTETNKLLDDYLAKVGISGDKVSRYTFACPPNGFGNPADMAAAAAQHKRDGVTHVIPLTGSGSFNRYVDAAEGQLFRPKYGVTDYQGVPVTATSNLKPNTDAFNGAIAMTTGLYGVESTPGVAIPEGTKRCQGIIAKAGLAPDLVFKGGGLACSQIWMVEAALKHAKSLNPDGILPGLFGAGTVQLAYTTPDAVFRAPNKFSGGDTFATIEYDKACSCWHLPERGARRPSYNP
jgi:hypothetical protein